MFSKTYQQADTCIPDGLIEGMFKHGYVAVHPKKPRFIKATPKLETFVTEGEDIRRNEVLKTVTLVVSHS